MSVGSVQRDGGGGQDGVPVVSRYLGGEQSAVHRVLRSPGVALPPVEMELAEPEPVLQGPPFECCSRVGQAELR